MTGKCVNRITACVMAMALIFTLLLLLWPQSVIGDASAAVTMEYQEKLFSLDHALDIDIRVDQQEWESMLENATDKEYIQCDVVIDGNTFTTVGIRAKGNSSLSTIASSDSDRVSFKLEFDHYVSGQTCYGLDKLALNSNYADATYMKEYLSYALFQFMDVPSSLCAFANITVNGEPWGCYLAVECLEESYALRNFGVGYGALYKPENMDMDGGRGAQGQNRAGVNLVYSDDEIDSYGGIFEGTVFSSTTVQDQSRVVEALKNLNAGANLEDYIDVDEVLRYFAVNTVLVNLDHYTGSMQHNYYLYEQDGKLSMLPWDYNLAFGGFQSGSASSAIHFPIDTPVSGTTLEERPMLGKLLEVPEYLQKYHEYLQQIITEFFESGYFDSLIDETDSMIGSLVQTDATAFYTYEEYQAAIAMLKAFGAARAQSIQGQLEGSIPSTEAEQTQNPEALVNASNIDLTVMGSQGGRGDSKFPGDDFENSAEVPFVPEQDEGLPQEGKPSFEGTLPSGEAFSPPDGGQRPPGNGTRGNREFDAGDNKQAMPPMSDNAGPNGFETSSQSDIPWPLLGICTAILLLALLFAKLFPMRRYGKPGNPSAPKRT